MQYHPMGPFLCFEQRYVIGSQRANERRFRMKKSILCTTLLVSLGAYLKELNHNM